jgi:hypothetical protein
MEHILNSPKAYQIFTVFRGNVGKYNFQDGLFKTDLTPKNYIFPVMIYLFSAIPYLLFLTSSDRLIFSFGFTSYFVLLLISSVLFLPMIYFSLKRVSGISKARYLQKVSQGSLEQSIDVNELFFEETVGGKNLYLITDVSDGIHMKRFSVSDEGVTSSEVESIHDNTEDDFYNRKLQKASEKFFANVAKAILLTNQPQK